MTAREDTDEERREVARLMRAHNLTEGQARGVLEMRRSFNLRRLPSQRERM